MKQTIDNLQHEIDQRGIVLNPRDRERLMSAKQQAISEAKLLHQDRQVKQSGLDRALAALPTIQAVLHQSNDVLQVLIQSLLTSFGLIVILIGVLIVEGIRVYEGIALFDAHVATMGAIVLVMLNTVLEFIVHYVEHKHGYATPPRYQFSFALVARRLRYIIGNDATFTPREKSPAHEFKLYMRLLTIGILFIALVGSMKDTIARVQGNWLDGFVSIFTQSTLSEFTVWLSGFMFALVTVIGAQRLTSYVAKRVTETLAHAETMTSTDSSLDHEIEAAIARVEREFYVGKIAQYDQKHAPQPIQPTQPTPPALDPATINEFQEGDTEPVNPTKPVMNGHTNGNGSHG